MNVDFADIKPSVLNWVIVGLMATTFIVFFKWFLSRYPITGLTDVMNAV